MTGYRLSGKSAHNNSGASGVGRATAHSLQDKTS